MKYLTLKKTWYSNGQTENQIELTDPKSKKYHQKMFYSSGQLKEEGTLVLSNDGKEYVKDGVWNFYDSSGKKKGSEKFVSNKVSQ
jgi:antitoxin component YwqK of YwqJK toxin-antitoxin module